MKKQNSIGEILFDALNYLFLVLLSITTLYPFWNAMVISISSQSAVTGLNLNLWPQNIDFVAWKMILNASELWVGFYNSVMRTLIATALSILLSVMTAYPLSKKFFPHKLFFTGFIVFTMFFSGGLIPTYLLIKNIGLMNSFWSMVIPGAIGAFNVVLFRNFFQSIPDSLEESAKIDGANDIFILFKIVLPLSMPIIATISLWSMVGNWNAYFDCLLYISDRSKYVLQVFLREIIITQTNSLSGVEIDMDTFLPPTSESLQAAATLFVMTPILISYPFLQKYFTKGILIGSLKG